MIDRLIRFSVYNRFVVLVLCALFAVAGWRSFQTLPIDALPDVTNVQVQINTPVEGLSPEETERGVTFPIENAMRGIAGVIQVRSLTRFNLSQVTVVFDDDMEIYKARQRVSERLQSLTGSLPNGARPQPGPVSSGLGEIFHYAIDTTEQAEGAARQLQLMELRTLQEWHVKQRLLTVPGVADVNTIGGFEKQYHVQPDSAKMARYGLHFDDLVEALSRVNRNVGGGYVQQSGEQFLVQAVGVLRDENDIRGVPVKTLGNMRTLTVGDVAEVGLATELRSGAGLVHGHEAVIGTVMMLVGENSRTVARRVAERIDEIGKGLPPGYRLEPLYDRSELVSSTVRTVEHNLLTGAFLVIVVLFLLIGNVRAALITALTIPLSLLGAFIFMKKLGVSGNLMSLGALDFGIIVDGAVILLDHCVRVIDERRKALGRALTGPERQEAVYKASVEIRTAAGFGELIIVVVFLPIFALVGIEGKMFQPMATTFIVAILSALALSFTMVPALASILLSGDAADTEPPAMSALHGLYEPILAKAMSAKRATLTIGAAAIVLGVVLYSRLGGEFMPQLDEGTILIQTTRPVNISLDQSLILQSKTELIAADFPEVAYTFSKLGTSEIANDPMGVHQADTYVMLKPEKERPKVNGHRRSKAELAAAMIDRLEAELPGQSVLLSQPIQMRFNDLLEGSKADVSVKLFGEDMDKLASLTRKMADAIGKVRGAEELEVELRGKSPLLRVTPKTEILRKMGGSSRDVLDAVGVALGGGEAGFVYEGVRRFPLVVRLPEARRSDLGAIRSLPVGVGPDTTVPLRDVAEVSFTQAYSTILREQGQRRAAVMINPRGRDTESFVLEAQAASAAAVPLPPGYYTEWSGTFQNLITARKRLIVLAPAALLLVLLMIFAAFKNLAQTAIVFLCVPMALLGGVVGLMVNGLPFSISAGVGFIALSGIAVLNGVVLMSYINDLRRQGLRGLEVAKKASLLRLRPVMMTALVDVFGFLPMMLSHGIGSEVQKPLASVVIGGIVSSTALTLLVLPAAYVLLEKLIDRFEARPEPAAPSKH